MQTTSEWLHVSCHTHSRKIEPRILVEGWSVLAASPPHRCRCFTPHTPRDTTSAAQPLLVHHLRLPFDAAHVWQDIGPTRIFEAARLARGASARKHIGLLVGAQSRSHMEGLGGVARPQWSSWAPLLSMDSTPTPWNCWMFILSCPTRAGL